MSSRRERQQKIYKTSSKVIVPQKLERVHKIPQRDTVLGSRANRGMRTISPKTWKIIGISIAFLFLLLLLSPKPPTPPGQALGVQSQTSLKPIDLKNVHASIPPIANQNTNALPNLFNKLK